MNVYSNASLPRANAAGRREPNALETNPFVQAQDINSKAFDTVQTYLEVLFDDTNVIQIQEKVPVNVP